MDADAVIVVLRRAITLNRHQRALLQAIKTCSPAKSWVPEYEHRDFERSIRALDTALARDLARFINSNIEVHDSLGGGIRTILEQPALWTTLVPVVAHFDYAVELGWKYAPCAIRMIGDALRDRSIQGLNPEQERALIAVENSTWTKEYTTGGGMMNRAYSYHECVPQAAADRPHDVQRIIAVAQQWNPQSIAQVDALVDGATSPALSEGAL